MVWHGLFQIGVAQGGKPEPTMETSASAPSETAEIDSRPPVPAKPLERLGKDQTLADRAMYLGLAGDLVVTSSMLWLTLWLRFGTVFSIGAQVEGLRVGYLGRLFETKGLESLIDAVIHGPHDSSRLIIAGSGESAYEQSLRARCAVAPGRVTFLGDVPPRALFEQIDVLAVPSLWHEPFGRVAIEANAWGIPVVASRRGGLPEIVEHGVTGSLFDPDDAGELTRLLGDLNPEQCQAMRTVCLQSAHQYLPEVIAGKYETLYRQVIDSAREFVPEGKAAAAKPGAAPVFEI